MSWLSKLMDRLTSSTVIQVNATIIAGLLILLTISSLSSNTVVSDYLRISDEIYRKQIEEQGLIDQKTYLENLTSSVDDEDRKKYLQQQLDDVELKYRQIDAEFRGLNSKKTELEKYSVSKGLFSFPAELRIVIFAMISPFAFSAIAEIMSVLSKKYNDTEKATKLGIVIMLVGFIMIPIGLNYIFGKST